MWILIIHIHIQPKRTTYTAEKSLRSELFVDSQLCDAHPVCFRCRWSLSIERIMQWRYCTVPKLQLNLWVAFTRFLFRKLVDSDFEDMQLVKSALKRNQVVNIMMRGCWYSKYFPQLRPFVEPKRNSPRNSARVLKPSKSSNDQSTNNNKNCFSKLFLQSHKIKLIRSKAASTSRISARHAGITNVIRWNRTSC